MFLSNIFKKYKEREYRILLMKDVIKNLDIDEKQKQMYIDSFDILDDESLTRFYNKLTSVIEIIEEDIDNKKNIDNKQKIFEIKKIEIAEKETEINTYNFILDNI